VEKAIEDDKEEKDKIAIVRKAEVLRLREVNSHYMCRYIAFHCTEYSISLLYGIFRCHFFDYGTSHYVVFPLSIKGRLTSM
jgi:hypothetical protein